MKNTDKAKLTINLPLWVTGKGVQRPAHSGKKVVEHDLWIEQNNRVQLMGDGKDHMKIIARQQVSLPVIEPLFFYQGYSLAILFSSPSVLKTYNRSVYKAHFLYFYVYQVFPGQFRQGS